MRSRPPESASAVEVLQWGLEEFGGRLAISTSFQAAGMVILDMAAELAPGQFNVITIDTGRLPPETYHLMTTVKDRYGVKIEVLYPSSRELSAMVTQHGPNLFYDAVAKRRLCCEVRKVRPLDRKLPEFDAWVVGLRRSQSESRETIPKIDMDEQHGGIYKLCPLADWSREEVWAYIREHNVPFHPLYDKGYTSIGCEPCTRATRDGEHGRAGRWWWEQDDFKECGIHFLPNGSVRREVDVLLDQVLISAQDIRRVVVSN